MSVDRTLTANRLRQVLVYDPGTGGFRWSASLNTRIRHGSVAGYKSHGYHLIQIDGVKHRAHRLAWLYVHGVWPADQIDHINGVKDDNRIANLREATQPQNGQNEHGPRRNNTSGFPGVNRHTDGRWRAHITIDRRQRFLGTFDTPEEASAAYVSAKRELHPFWAA